MKGLFSKEQMREYEEETRLQNRPEILSNRIDIHSMLRKGQERGATIYGIASIGFMAYAPIAYEMWKENPDTVAGLIMGSAVAGVGFVCLYFSRASAKYVEELQRREDIAKNRLEEITSEI